VKKKTNSVNKSLLVYSKLTVLQHWSGKSRSGYPFLLSVSEITWFQIHWWYSDSEMPLNEDGSYNTRNTTLSYFLILIPTCLNFLADVKENLNFVLLLVYLLCSTWSLIVYRGNNNRLQINNIYYDLVDPGRDQTYHWNNTFNTATLVQRRNISGFKKKTFFKWEFLGYCTYGICINYCSQIILTSLVMNSR
jgi:hypothetical protein